MTVTLWRQTAVVACTILVLGVGACGNEKSDDDGAAITTTTSAENTTSTAKPLPGAAPIITESANGSTQTLTYVAGVAETALRINLQTAGGSGYTWKITKRPDPKIVTADAPTQEPTTPRPTSGDGTPLVGAPETVSTLLTAAGTGTTSIELSHVGPTGAVDKTFKITIVVS